nr:MAG TPA: hypothetical protein [Caudoviricetes sp.]
MSLALLSCRAKRAFFYFMIKSFTLENASEWIEKQLLNDSI